MRKDISLTHEIRFDFSGVGVKSNGYATGKILVNNEIHKQLLAANLPIIKNIMEDAINEELKKAGATKAILSPDQRIRKESPFLFGIEKLANKAEIFWVFGRYLERNCNHALIAQFIGYIE